MWDFNRFSGRDYIESLRTGKSPSAPASDEANKTFDWGSLFDSKVEDREIVTPRMGYWEKNELNSFIESNIVDEDFLQKVQNEPFFREKIAGKKVDASVANNFTNYDVLKKYQQMFPKYYSYNLNNFYYNKAENMKIENTDGNNKWQFDLLQKMDNYYMKAVTHESKLGAGMFTSELIKRMVYRAMLTEQNPDEQFLENQAGGSQDSSGGGTPQKGKGSPSPGKGGNDLEDLVKDAAQSAQDKIEDLENLEDLGLAPGDQDSGDESDEEGGQQAGSGSAEMTLRDAQSLQEMKKLMGNIQFNVDAVKSFVKEVIKRGKTYFSSQYKTYYDELLEADSDDIENLEDIHPVFRGAHLEDIMVRERHYFSRFNIFIDDSGSMHGSTNVKYIDKDGKTKTARVDRPTLCKAIALKMDKEKLLEEYALFDYSIHNFGKDKAAFLKARYGGGTDTDSVLRHIGESEKPAIVVSDGCDSVNHYTEHAYILYINQGSLRGLDNRYFSNGQVATYHNGNFYVPTSESDLKKYYREN